MVSTQRSQCQDSAQPVSRLRAARVSTKGSQCQDSAQPGQCQDSGQPGSALSAASANTRDVSWSTFSAGCEGAHGVAPHGVTPCAAVVALDMQAGVQGLAAGAM
ncbi:hypothetical protein HaLaN_15433 [Haematococcus lacustris]|uniref:Uncharacterized protein n=1 Tax=Haematococcus lacustris TaxID=44745 RepID=A0A699Z8U6_HAELA|nr:hypothetical protein HaLaN_15433 [Haematococcus lacustris]